LDLPLLVSRAAGRTCLANPLLVGLPAPRSYRDELLCTCLQLLLAAPPAVLSPRELLGPLKLALQTGLAFPPVAGIAVATLESWEALEATAGAERAARDAGPALDPAAYAGATGGPAWGGEAGDGADQRCDLRSMLPEILPLVEPYLRDLPAAAAAAAGGAAAGGGGDAGADEGLDGAAGRERDATGYLRAQRDRAATARRVKEERRQVGDRGFEGGIVTGPGLGVAPVRPACRRLPGPAHARAPATPQGLESLQPRLLLWLGRMGSAAHVLAEADGGSGAVWDIKRRLRMGVPFPELKNRLTVGGGAAGSPAKGRVA
jgi:hypothetical protein